MISLLLPVWNSAPFLQQALDSCLAQTHRDFEFIACDDGSTDATPQILAACRDPRLRLLRNEQNRGLCFTRNRLLEAASGEYLAWADADDVYHPERLARQLAYMEEHPECGALSACMNRIEDGKRVARPAVGDVNGHDVLKIIMVFRSPLNSPVSLIRAAALEGLSYPAWRRGDGDYWMWWQLARSGRRLALLPDRLCDYRIHPAQDSRRRDGSVAAQTREVRAGIAADLLGRPLGEDELALHLQLVDPTVAVPREGKDIERLIAWMEQLALACTVPEERAVFRRLAVEALGKKGLQLTRGKP